MAGGQDSADFKQLVERRRKFIDGLDANKGEINLDIFEDFYPDKAHFVYELLQNAEDAGATDIAFKLTPEKLVCEHNGRTFTIADVASITGLHDSTKANATDKIGKFGVGFKSVFVYTQAPTIQSGDFTFRIVRLTLPEPTTTVQMQNGRTRFEFPFDKPKKPPQEAYREIAHGLTELDEKTLLFLSNLQSITWQISTESIGEVLRHQHSEFHIEVLKLIDGRTASSSHFLKFDQAIPGLEKQRVAVAFPLDVLSGVRSFDATARLADQLKIVPAEPGSVAVFFPAVKEASGLRFHLHGPFVPELSRASIKEAESNSPLFDQLAVLAANSLHHIKELGFLTPDFLAVLPNLQDQIPLRYARIRSAIIEEMRSQPLTPTHDRKHAPANRLIQARASLKSLLSEDDIEFLVDYEDEPPLWAVGATQRNSRIDNFLSSLDIRDWGLDEFVDTLCDKADDTLADDPDEAFLDWLSRKPAAWVQEFYALLNSEAGNESHRLEDLRIVRLADGGLSRADRAFFASEMTGDDLPIVDRAVYATGTAKKQQQDAKAFLSLIGVREVGEAEEIEITLRSRYTKDADAPIERVYLENLNRFITLIEKQPDKARLFSEYYIFQGQSDAWHKPGGIYLDRPYMDTGLAAYYNALISESKPTRLHSRYLKCGIEAKKLGDFAKAVGAKSALEISRSDCSRNPQRNYLYSAGGNWTYNGTDRDYFIPHLDEMLKSPSIELSRLIWRTLRGLPPHPDYLTAVYRNNLSHNPRYAAARLVHDLRDATWVPQGDGVFVRPADASRELLPKGFAFDVGDTWLAAVRFGEAAARQSEEARQKEAAAKSLGFADAASAERARRFNELPQAEQEKILSALEDRNKPAVPDRALANPERRAQSVREQALKAPNKQSEIRERSVSLGREDVKVQADAYLREHYRNADGEVTCQICKGPLPFKLDGQEYFEVVEFLPELTKSHHQNYLALCPNHSVMFQHGNGSRATMREAFLALADNELAVFLADQDLTIYFSKTHILDLKAVLEAEEVISVSESPAATGA